MYTVAALYKFFDLEDCKPFRETLHKFCLSHDILGSLLIAPEGINGTVSGMASAIEALHGLLAEKIGSTYFSFKISTSERCPFYRLKVRLKKEIVTLGQPGVSPHKHVGKYLTSQEWHTLLDDPEVMVIDTRNDYEVKLGRFKGALNPQTQSFRQFPTYVAAHLAPHKKKKVAMYCTGGIRCEKSTAYLLDQGFEEVFHLKDGILKYLEEIPEAQSKWDGECFVFDQRVTVTHGLSEGNATLCYGCQQPLTAADRADDRYEAGVSCPFCHGKRTAAQVAAARERQKQQKLALQRGAHHIGRTSPST